MKLQRYDVWGCGLNDREPNDHAEWCDTDDVSTLESENTALHAECDRLTAMLGPQEPMSAEEVTEPGYYMVKYHNSNMIVEEISDDDIEDGHIDPGSQYIGPLRWPEVQG